MCSLYGEVCEGVLLRQQWRTPYTSGLESGYLLQVCNNPIYLWWRAPYKYGAPSSIHLAYSFYFLGASSLAEACTRVKNPVVTTIKEPQQQIERRSLQENIQHHNSNHHSLARSRRHYIYLIRPSTACTLLVHECRRMRNKAKEE